MGDKWNYSFSWIFHLPGNDLIFGPDCPLPRALLKKYPCSNRVWKLTMLQKNLSSDHAPENLRSDHAPSKNEYGRVPPKCEKWPQLLAKHGYFLSKALGSGQTGPKIKSLPGGWKFKKMNTSIHWRETVIFIFWWSTVASHIVWSMVASQIFLENGQFSNFVGTWIFFDQSSW